MRALHLSGEARGQSCLLSLPLQVKDVRAAQRFEVRVCGQFAGRLGAGLSKPKMRTKFRVQKTKWGWQRRCGPGSTVLEKNVGGRARVNRAKGDSVPGRPFHRWESCPQGHGPVRGPCEEIPGLWEDTDSGLHSPRCPSAHQAQS